MPWKFIVKDLLLALLLVLASIPMLVMRTTAFLSFLSSHFHLKWFMSLFSAFIWTKFCPRKSMHKLKKFNEIKNWFIRSFQASLEQIQSHFQNSRKHLRWHLFVKIFNVYMFHAINYIPHKTRGSSPNKVKKMTEWSQKSDVTHAKFLRAHFFVLLNFSPFITNKTLKILQSAKAHWKGCLCA